MIGHHRGVLGALRRQIRDVEPVRAALMRMMAIGRQPQNTSNWLAVPMYHGIEAAARGSFARQLAYMRSIGELLTAAQALELLTRNQPLGGRYFCITFDDGRLDAFTHALPILREAEAPSTFFVVPDWLDIGQQTHGTYMSWDNCRAMAETGVTIGSHSMSHRRLADLDAEQARQEMTLSKHRLETELGRACDHFACPWGQADEDYVPDRDPDIAAEAGYRSFFTTQRGSSYRDTSPWAIPRVRLEPQWGLAQLRYLFTR